MTQPLTPAELRAAADAAERWPKNRQCKYGVYHARREVGESDVDHVMRCGCPAMVIQYRRAGKQHSASSLYDPLIVDALNLVYANFIFAIDAGRGAEVAAAFRAEAERLEMEPQTEARI